jgi:hypothetical protein
MHAGTAARVASWPGVRTLPCTQAAPYELSARYDEHHLHLVRQNQYSLGLFPLTPRITPLEVRTLLKCGRTHISNGGRSWLTGSRSGRPERGSTADAAGADREPSNHDS